MFVVSLLQVKRVIGPFGGDGLESVLDVQYGGSIARGNLNVKFLRRAKILSPKGTTVWFWTGQRWLLEFAQEFFAAKDVRNEQSSPFSSPECFFLLRRSRSFFPCLGVRRFEEIARSFLIIIFSFLQVGTLLVCALALLPLLPATA